MKPAKKSKLTPSRILDVIRRELVDSDNYTYIVMGKSGPTGKTWLCKELRRYGYTAFEVAESTNLFVKYGEHSNTYIVDSTRTNRVVTIILNDLLEPAKEMTLEEIEAKLGHRVKVISTDTTKSETPTKTVKLCTRCKYGNGKGICAFGNCPSCVLRDCDGRCKCNKIPYGDPCPYFEEVPNND